MARSKRVSKETEAPVENTNTETEDTMSDTENTTTPDAGEVPAEEIIFFDELPKAQRASRDNGVWVERLKPVRENQGKFGLVYKTGDKSPHAVVNNLRQGNAAGIDPAEWTFSARVDKTQGGLVFARFDTPEQRAEREAEQAKRREAREAAKAKKEAEAANA